MGGGLEKVAEAGLPPSFLSHANNVKRKPI